METQTHNPLLVRPAPVLALPNPWEETALADDPGRLAAHEQATRTANKFAVLTAAKAADMLRRTLPGATIAIIERDYNADCECHRWRLRLVRDQDGTVLWYEDPFDDHPDVVRRDELELAGGPVLPVLDIDTREAIERLVDAAQGWASILDDTDVTVIEERDGQQTETTYEGEFYLLDVDVVLYRAATLADAPTCIDLDRLCDVLVRTSGMVVGEDIAALMAVVRAEAARPAFADRGVTR